MKGIFENGKDVDHTKEWLYDHVDKMVKEIS